MTPASASASSGRPVVVGHDGSPAADTALRFALQHAATGGTSVEVVCAWDLDLGAALAPVPPAARAVAAAEEEAGRTAAAAVDRVRADDAGVRAVDVRVDVVRGRPTSVLTAASARAELVVVGRRGRGGVRQLLGSTSTAVLRSASCPVAVVPLQAPAGPDRVVVGWDGSGPAEAALAWAAAHAAAGARPLEVVVGWQVTTLHRAVLQEVSDDVAVAPPLSAYERLAAAEAERGAARAVELAGGRLSRQDVTGRAVHRPPAAALLEAAQDAGLLVVGSRGRGGFAGLVLGSTSDQLSRHAPGPVVVVRGSADAVEDAD